MTGSAPIDWLLVPGWGFSTAVFAPIQQALLPVALAETVNCRDAAAAIDARVAAVRSGQRLPFGICGWSLGATIALDRIANCADAVHALVMLGATPRFVASDTWHCAMDTTAFDAFTALAARSTRHAQTRLAILSAKGEVDPAAVQHRLCAALDLPADLNEAPAHDQALRAALQCLRTTDLRPALPACRTPVTLVHGSRDALVPVEAARMMKTLLPSARLIEVSEGGHAFFVQRTRFVAELLAARSAPPAPSPTALAP